MPWSSGTFTRSNGTHTGATAWAQDDAAGSNITTDRHDTHDEDLADGIDACINKDGSNAFTGDADLGSNKVTLVADAAARTDAPNAGQVQNSSFIWCGTAGGTADAITLTLSPAITAYAAGQEFRWKASASANTGAATVAVSGLAAKALEINDSALSAGDHAANKYYRGLYDGTAFQIEQISGVRTSFTASSTDTLTNKTFDANATGNSLSNVDVADLAAGTDGELITWDADGAPATVPAGTATHVLTSNGAGAPPTFQAPGSGKIIQIVSGTITAATGTTTFPGDDTEPTNTEGTEIFSGSITPTSASNVVRVQGNVRVSGDAGNPIAVAVFRGSTNIGTADCLVDATTTAHGVPINIVDSPATTSSTTYSLRIGVHSTTGNWNVTSRTARFGASADTQSIDLIEEDHS